MFDRSLSVVNEATMRCTAETYTYPFMLNRLSPSAKIHIQYNKVRGGGGGLFARCRSMGGASRAVYDFIDQTGSGGYSGIMLHKNSADAYGPAVAMLAFRMSVTDTYGAFVLITGSISPAAGAIGGSAISLGKSEAPAVRSDHEAVVDIPAADVDGAPIVDPYTIETPTEGANGYVGGQNEVVQVSMRPGDTLHSVVKFLDGFGQMYR